MRNKLVIVCNRDGKYGSLIHLNIRKIFKTILRQFEISITELEPVLL